MFIKYYGHMFNILIYNHDGGGLELIPYIAYSLFFIYIILMILILRERTIVKDEYDEANFVIPDHPHKFRDIPFEKDFLLAYFIGKKEGLIKKKNLIGAFLLKWIKDGKIIINSNSSDVNINCLELTSNVDFDSKIEQKLYNLLKAMSVNGILTHETLKKGFRKKRGELKKWFTSAETYSKKQLVEKGYIKVEKRPKSNKKKFKFKPWISKECAVSDKIFILTEDLAKESVFWSTLFIEGLFKETLIYRLIKFMKE